MGIKEFFQRKWQRQPLTFNIHAPKTVKESMAGMIEQVPLQNIKEAGEAHPFDYAITENLYKKMGIVSGAIDKIVDFVWGPGFFTKSEDERAKKIIDQWLQDVNFDSHGRKWLREALIKGTGFLELGGNENEAPQGIKVLNANNVYIKRDPKGKILQYSQVKPGLGRTSRTDIIPFTPHKIAHISINQIGDSPYGLGIIHSSISTLNNLLGLQKDMHKLMERKANSPIIVTLGNRETGELPTPEDVTAFSQKLQFMNNQTEWTVDDMVRITNLNFGNISDKFTPIIDHDVQMLIFAFQVPEVLFGTGSIPEGLAKVQMDAFERRIKSIQVEVEKVIEEKVFKRILQANGLDVHVEFEWGEPSDEETNEQIQNITKILENPMLGTQLRIELEKRLASLLKLPKDAIETPEEERKREEEQTPQPRVPGSNQNECTHTKYDESISSPHVHTSQAYIEGTLIR